MELLYAAVIAVMVSAAVFLLLRARTFSVVMGLCLLGYSVNLFLVAMGRLSLGTPAIVIDAEQYADPVPQALVLTAIVIGFAMTAFMLVLALKARGVTQGDHVDGISSQESVH